MHNSRVDVNGVIPASSLLENLLTLKKAYSASKKGLSTGYQSLDANLLLNKQYLMILTGMPSSGKSEVLDGIAVNTAVLHDWSWLYFSPENFPLEEHLKKIVEKKVGKALWRMTEKEVRDATQWVEDKFTWLYPPDDKISLDNILEITKEHIESGHHVDALVIDPWNELDHSAQAGKRDDQYISHCLTKIRRFHRQYDLLTCIVIHPKGLDKDKSGNYPVPTLYDCNGGAMWRNKADYGLCVHRHDLTRDGASVYIQKIKYKSMGQIGALELDYDKSSGRFKDKLAPTFDLPEAPDAPPF